MRRAPLLLVLLLAAAAVAGGAAAHGYYDPTSASDGTESTDAAADRPDADTNVKDGGAPRYAFCNKTERVVAEGGGSMRRLNLENCPAGMYECPAICGGCCASA